MLRNTPEISVIIPCYNVEKYLDRTVRSVIAQTFENWELILIDDGSKDNTAAICDGWASVDSRIKAFHQENMGASEARNHGMKLAEGKFINFIDSDDWVDIRYLEDLINTQKKSDADLTVSGMTTVSGANHHEYRCEKKAFDRKTYDSLFADVRYISLMRGPCCKLFLKKLIYDNDLTFHSGIRFGEDLLFVLRYLICTRSVSFSGNSNYYYEQHPQSLCHSIRKCDYKEALLTLNEFKSVRDLCFREFELHNNLTFFLNRQLLHEEILFSSLLGKMKRGERITRCNNFDMTLYREKKRPGTIKEKFLHLLFFNRFFGLFDFVVRFGNSLKSLTKNGSE